MGFQAPWYVTLLPFLPILLTYLAGLVVGIILAARGGKTPAILAAVGFGVLFLIGLVSYGRPSLVRLLVNNLGGMGQRVFLIDAVTHCCCNLFNLAALICLIVALWQAMTGGGTDAGGEV